MSRSVSVYVDFNTMMQDPDERVRVSPLEVRPSFRDGMRVIIGDETLRVNAVLERDEKHRAWWARPDWSTRCDAPLAAHAQAAHG